MRSKYGFFTPIDRLRSWGARLGVAGLELGEDVAIQVQGLRLQVTNAVHITHWRLVRNVRMDLPVESLVLVSILQFFCAH